MLEQEELEHLMWLGAASNGEDQAEGYDAHLAKLIAGMSLVQHQFFDYDVDPSVTPLTMDALDIENNNGFWPENEKEKLWGLKRTLYQPVIFTTDPSVNVLIDDSGHINLNEKDRLDAVPVVEES